eukprot:TRINITY_DN4594_c0_g3_i1.p1 TRINITY_DN4594_c0_g3~~TRINITY_DN4594_c0_g3_i1.p1  ORF type:complete len:559 (+),score=101.80 TRINITY_DN4594_c0_g3_i1:192-1868(+)
MAEEWGTNLVKGELLIHVVEGRNLAVAAGKTSSGKGSVGGDEAARLALRVRRKGDKCCETEWKVIGRKERRTQYDAKMIFEAPPVFDLIKGKLEFELVTETEVVLAKAHVALSCLVHVAPGQTHTVDLLIVPAVPSLPPEKLPREISPGVKIVIYPDFPSSNPNPSPARSRHSSSGGAVSSHVPSPRRSLRGSPLRQSGITRFKTDEEKPIRAVEVTVVEASGLPEAVSSKVQITYQGETKETSLWKGKNPTWNELLSLTVPPGMALSGLDDTYLHTRLCTTNGPIGSVDVEVGHLLQRGGLDMWVACDKEMRSRLTPRSKSDGTSVQTAVSKASSSWVRLKIGFGRADAEFAPMVPDSGGPVQHALPVEAPPSAPASSVPQIEVKEARSHRKIPPPPDLNQSNQSRNIRHLPASTSPMSSVWRSDRKADTVALLPLDLTPVVEVEPVRQHVAVHPQPVAPSAGAALQPTTTTPTYIPRNARDISPPRPMWGVAHPSSVVRSWLEGIGIIGREQREVIDYLTKHNVTDLASLLTLTETDLSSFGIPLGLRRRMAVALG